MYIISQIFFIIGALVILSTYYLKNRRLILGLSIGACIAYFVAYILLGAYTGAVLNLVSILASVWFFIELEKKGKRSTISLTSVVAITIVLTLLLILLGYESLISLLATVALLGFMVSIWQDNLLVHKWLGILTAVCWIVYNIYYNSIMAIVMNSIFIIIDMIAILRYYKVKK